MFNLINFIIKKSFKEKISSILYMENLERLSRTTLLNIIMTQQQTITNLTGLLNRKSEQTSLKCRWAVISNAHDSYFVESLKYNPENKVHFITQTFDEKHYMPKHLDDQANYFHKTIDKMQHKYNLYKIVYCLEHHASGVVHAHILAHDPEYNNLIEFEYELRTYFTNESRKQNPINQKVDPVKKTSEDFNRILDYMSKNPIIIKTDLCYPRDADSDHLEEPDNLDNLEYYLYDV